MGVYGVVKWSKVLEEKRGRLWSRNQLIVLTYSRRPEILYFKVLF
jgi:hypothetical protein